MHLKFKCLPPSSISQLAVGPVGVTDPAAAMDPRLLAFEAARRQFVDGDATAAARDLAHAFGAVHPEAGTLRAIQAVIDQLDNPSSFARNKDAYEKHGATQSTFNKWKKMLTALVVDEEVDTTTPPSPPASPMLPLLLAPPLAAPLPAALPPPAALPTPPATQPIMTVAGILSAMRAGPTNCVAHTGIVMSIPGTDVVPQETTDTGLRMSAAVEETHPGTPSEHSGVSSKKRSREAVLEQVLKAPRTALGGSSRSSAAATEETPVTAVVGSSASGSSASGSSASGSSASGPSAAATDALNGLLAELWANIRALCATNPSHIDEAQLSSAHTAKYLLGGFIAGVEAQQEAIRNPPPAETPLLFDDMVHTLSFLDCKSLSIAPAVSRHWRRAAPEAVMFRLNHLSGAYSCYGSMLGEPTAQLLAQAEREFNETPALIQRFSLSQTDPEVQQTSGDLKRVQTHVLRLHSNLLWEKVREAGEDESGSKEVLMYRYRLFAFLSAAELPEDNVAPHAACVVNMLQTFGEARTKLSPIYCLDALALMSRMPVAVIEKHIGSAMLLLNKNEEDAHCELVRIFCLKVITKLSPEKLASLNLKPRIAAILHAKLLSRSEREHLTKLLRTIPDFTKA